MLKNPFIGDNLSDPIEKDDSDRVLYSLDCHNINICKSYGEISYACLTGANANTRCSLGDKMRIRILNDTNPNATYMPKKNPASENED